MARFFCTIEHRATDRRMTAGVEAGEHEQAKVRAGDIFGKAYPRKIGEIRKLDVCAMRL
jgi:hypothetical protein